MASVIKKFFQKKKLDVKFKKAGEGHKLNEERPSTSHGSRSNERVQRNVEYNRSTSEEKQRAAEAALARSQGQSKTAPDPSMAAKARMRRELELEKKKEQEAIALSQKYSEPQEVVKDSAPMATILFTCPDIGPAVLPKEDMVVHIKEFLLSQLAEEPEMASALMIHTLNKDADRVKVCIDTLCKYLDNIINNPGEEKFRKIRISNKAFSERIASLEGTEEFLQAAGFEVKLLPFEDHDERFFVMDETNGGDIERLNNLKAVLRAAEPIRPKLDRAMKVFYPTNSAAKFSIPTEFYSISPEELKKEQQRKQEAVESLGMLRTKAMREREERRELLKYRYTIIRVRFPDGNLLQGTFKATEKLPALIEFVRENLENDWMPFHIVTQVGAKLDDENKMLAEYGLTPAAVVNFEWDKTVLKEVTAQQGSSQKQSPLKQDVLACIQDL
ncbi:UBX domain-containing protein 6 [Mactra antiquata]